MLNRLYWILPIVLFILQAIYTFNTLNQIRYEELDESILNPFWVQNGYVSNGASANLGWHFLLVAVYNVFGFDLFTGKFVRLGLWLISLFCLAGLLRNYLGEKRAWLPLVTIGLSPTILYFNTQQTVYGIDVAFFPIILFFISLLDFKQNSDRNLVLTIAVFCLVMIAWMSYPAFIYFLPSLGVLYFWKLWQSPNSSRLMVNGSQKGQRSRVFLAKNLLIGSISFLLPLAAAFIYIQNRSLLIYDENVNSGIFRGAGFFDFDLAVFFANLKSNIANLFLGSSGYYFELSKVEFSDLYPIITLIFLVFAVFKLWGRKQWRLPIMLTLVILEANILFSYFTSDQTPGLRRQTGILAGIYIFFVFAWYYWTTLVKNRNLRKYVLVPIGLLFLLHHLVVYPINLSHLKDPSRYREQVWFKTLDDPRKNLDDFVVRAQKENLEFVCYDERQNAINCRYNQIFAAVSAYCYWNKIVCREIRGYDLKTKKYIPLSIELFNEYYFGRYGKEVIAT